MSGVKRIILLVVVFAAVVVLVSSCLVVLLILPNANTQAFPASTQAFPANASVQVLPGLRWSPARNVTGRVLVVRQGDRSLFILGVVFVAFLFVALIVAVVGVCVWAGQTRGYLVQRDDYQTSVENEGVELKRNCNNSNPFLVRSTKVASLTSPPANTVIVKSQVNGIDCEDVGEAVVGEKRASDVSTRVSRRQDYGTLTRSRLLSSVDEDGYHVDNLGFSALPDPDAADILPDTADILPDTADILPSLDPTSREKPSNSIADELIKTFELELQKSSVEEAESPVSSPSEDSKGPDAKQLTKQDSFQGLPPLKAFDDYLTLVRLDSTTSFESVNLEDVKKDWEKIEEDDE